MDVVRAPYFMVQAAEPHLRQAKGFVINIVDVAAFSAWQRGAHYGASKAGLAMVTRSLALELAPDVRVCAIAPGTVVFPDDYNAHDRNQVLKSIPSNARVPSRTSPKPHASSPRTTI